MLLSDLSPPHTGNRTADVSHSVTLLRAVWDFARKTLKTRGDYHRERVQAEQWLRQDREREGRPLDTDLVEVQDESAEKKAHVTKTRKSAPKEKSILRDGGIVVYVVRAVLRLTRTDIFVMPEA